MADDEWDHLNRFDVPYLLGQSEKKVKEFTANLGEAMKKSEIPPGWKECQFTPCICGSLRVIQRENWMMYRIEYNCTSCDKSWLGETIQDSKTRKPQDIKIEIEQRNSDYI